MWKTASKSNEERVISSDRPDGQRLSKAGL